MNIKIKLKKGDEVIVNAGKDKGKTGKITLVKPQNNKAIVSGINKVKKHTKPDNNQAGGIIEKEMPINISNLSFYDATLKKGVRLGYLINDKNKKIRINKQTKKEV
jgi:large subunit ribosomal protein L24|tara:strand:- start:200 stop:517 length:318 start_codon:yes stop_codon:yes gene_type:complete